MFFIAMRPRGGTAVWRCTAGMVQSCDVYYYNVGLKLGVDRIAKWSKKFGLGAPTGVILDSEKGRSGSFHRMEKETFQPALV